MAEPRSMTVDEMREHFESHRANSNKPATKSVSGDPSAEFRAKAKALGVQGRRLSSETTKEDVVGGVAKALDEVSLGVGKRAAAGLEAAVTDQTYDEILRDYDNIIQKFEQRNPNAAPAVDVGTMLAPGLGVVKSGSQVVAKGAANVMGKVAKKGAAKLAEDGAKKAAMGYVIRKYVPYRYVPAFTELTKKLGGLAKLSPTAKVAAGAAKTAVKFAPATQRMLSGFAAHGGGPGANALRKAFGAGLTGAQAMQEAMLEAGLTADQIQLEIAQYLAETEKQRSDMLIRPGMQGRNY